MKTIYNVYVPIEDQPQADRMKQICIDYGLPIFKLQNSFEFNEFDKYFGYHKELNVFAIWSDFDKDETQVTESEFLELVKINFANSK